VEIVYASRLDFTLVSNPNQPWTYLEHQTRGITFGGHMGITRGQMENTRTGGTAPWDITPLLLDGSPTVFTFSGSRSFFLLPPWPPVRREQSYTWYEQPNLFTIRIPVDSQIICTTRCDGLSRYVQ
jgi:hypothetical protein